MAIFLHYLRKYWKALSLFIFFAIGLLSLLPLDELPPAPGSDKLHHLLAYAVLVIPLVLQKPKYWWLIVVFYLVYSGLIELIQPYVNRYGEWQDMAANSMGIVFGIIIAELLNFYFPDKFKYSESKQE